MTIAVLSSSFAFMAVLFVEWFGSSYPSRETWRKLRSSHGRRAVRAMRERFEDNSLRKTPRRLAELLLGLLIVWVACAPLLDKRWFEVALEAVPYAIASIALLRTPACLRMVAERMKEYERNIGEDPERDLGDDGGGPQVLAL